MSTLRISQKVQAELEDRKMKIEELGLSTRTSNALRRAGLEKVESLLAIDNMHDLIRIRNLGKLSLSELITKMHEHGFDKWAPTYKWE